MSLFSYCQLEKFRKLSVFVIRSYFFVILFFILSIGEGWEVVGICNPQLFFVLLFHIFKLYILYASHLVYVYCVVCAAQLHGVLRRTLFAVLLKRVHETKGKQEPLSRFSLGLHPS